MDDWNNYPSQPLLERMMNADGDKDKLETLSSEIQNAVEIFLVSFPCKSRAKFQ